MFKKLEALLIETGITRTELAARIGITYNTLNQKINHKSPFTIDEAFKIKKVLNTKLSLDEIFKNDFIIM